MFGEMIDEPLHKDSRSGISGDRKRSAHYSNSNLRRIAYATHVGWPPMAIIIASE
jgi:hypothetical protein